MHAVEALRPESQGVITGTYIMNFLWSRPAELDGVRMTADRAFFHLATEKIKPGGRIVIVQDKGNIREYKAIAAENRLEFRAIEISDARALKSASHAIRRRATPKRRLFHMTKQYYPTGHPDSEHVRSHVRAGIVSSPQDYARPTVFIMRKPKPREKTKQKKSAVLRVDSPELSPEMKRIARDIINGK